MDRGKYILLTPELKRMFYGLSASDVGKLFTAMMEYAFRGEIPKAEKLPDCVSWSIFKEYVDTQRKYLRHDGERHWNWKGGITPENAKIRSSSDYAHWRKGVFERDRFTCQMCGRFGCKLNAHHIKPFSKYPDLRLDLNNGITLCEKCHKRIHKKVK